MKMSKVSFCEKCFERIGKESGSAARIWTDLCLLHQKHQCVLVLQCIDFEELRLLEGMDFVTSTEKLCTLHIKVHGERHDEEGVFYCLGHRHE
jgi:hypothetical protein